MTPLQAELDRGADRIASATIIAKALVRVTPNLIDAKFHALTAKLKDGRMTKSSVANLKTLPGIIAGATREMNDEAGLLAVRFRKALDRKNTAFARGHGHAEKIEQSVAEVERFADEMDSAIGDNGDPT